jgi:hypothetical protein
MHLKFSSHVVDFSSSPSCSPHRPWMRINYISIFSLFWSVMLHKKNHLIITHLKHLPRPLLHAVHSWCSYVLMDAFVFWFCATYIALLEPLFISKFWRLFYSAKQIQFIDTEYTQVGSTQTLHSFHWVTLVCISHSFLCFRSNFLGTKFIIYVTHPPYNSAQLSPSGRSRWFNSTKVSP